MKCVIYDYETLGTDVRTCPILSLALYEFNTARFASKPYTVEEILADSKFYKFSVADQVENYGKKISKDTLDWWNSQPKELKESQLKPSKNDLQLAALYDIMVSTVGANTYFTRGNTFDPMITQFMMESLKKPDPIEFWKVRDTRSFIEGLSYGSDLKNNFTPPEIEGKNLPLHDPRVDIALDVLRMQTLIRAIS